MLDINCLTVRSKLTKEELLHSISFSVGEGETFGLIGESGSGKSMTSKCIMRLLNSRAFQIRGEIRWNGRDVFSMNAKELADYIVGQDSREVVGGVLFSLPVRRIRFHS